jgi:hypothetical protein
MNNYLVKKAKISLFSSLSEKQKLKLHIFKMVWATVGYTKRHKDLSEGVREDIGDMKKYWNVRKGARYIMGNKERDWAMADFFWVIIGWKNK